MNTNKQPRKPFNPWPLVGVLSVLIPALVFAYIGWRSESQQQSQVQEQLSSSTPEQVVAAFFRALGQGREDVARDALDPSATGISTGDPGFRGLTKVEVSPLAGTSSAIATGSEVPSGSHAAEGSQTRVLVTFVTVRPWEGGGVPGPQKRRVELEKQDGRWLIVRVAPVP